MTRPVAPAPLPHASPLGSTLLRATVPLGAPPRPSPVGTPTESGFRAALRTQLLRLADGERAMDAMVRGSMAGRTLGTAELLAMQAGVYRYGQEIELLSRLVDRASAAVKQTLQSQT